MDTISFNPERYQIEITNMMDKFFNDSILSFNPYEKDELFITNWFFVKFGGNLFFISTVSLFFLIYKSCRYVCFLVTLKTPHH